MVKTFIKIFIIVLSISSCLFSQKSPDLVLNGYAYTSNFRSGQNNEFVAYIMNQGDTIASSSVFKIYLSPDTLKKYIDVNTDILIIEHRYPAIEAGGMNEYSQNKFTIPQLEIGSKWMMMYYVDANNEVIEPKSNNLGQLSIVEILPPLQRPELIAPKAEEKLSLPITLKWNKAKNATSYMVNYYQRTTNYNNIYNKRYADVDDTTFIINEITTASTYYWNVISKDSYGYDVNEHASEERSFYVNGPTTQLNKPQLISPVNNSTNISTSTSLSWLTTKEVMNFRIQVSTDPKFLNIINDLTDKVYSLNQTVETSYDISNLAYDTEYFWRVKFINDGGESIWSDVWEFRTKPLFLPLEAPVLSNPTNKLSNVGTEELSFVWEEVNERLYYEIQIAIDQEFANMFYTEDSIKVNYVIMNNLKYNTKYYWRVRAKNNYNQSGWSEVYSFQTLNEPVADYLYAPQLLTPENGASEIMNRIKFTWTKIDSATGYLFEMARDTIMKNSYWNNSTIYNYINVNVDFSTKYYWRIKPYTNTKIGSPSKVRSFSTMPITGVLSTVYLKVPNNVEEQVTTNPTLFKWTKDDNATSYDLHIAKERDFKNVLMKISIESDTIYNIFTLEPNNLYFWKVRSVNQYYEGDWSGVYQFKTKLLTGMQKEYYYPVTTFLYQNYPNPFNPETKIRYDLTKESKVTLIIYDILGREVKNLVNSVQKPGTYSVIFSAKEMASGIYFLRLQTENYIKIGKMILLK